MRIIVGSDIAHCGERIGAFDNRMAYILGLQRLGHKVYVFADVNPNRCFDANYHPLSFKEWEGRQQFEALARSYGIWPHCCLIYKNGEATYGMSLTDAIKIAQSSDLLLNISEKLKTPDILEGVKYRVFIDQAPAKTQVYHAGYGIDQGFDQHQHFFTVGLNIGTAACDIPTCGLTWHPIMHPVVLDLWSAWSSDQHQRFTTITNWAGKEPFNMQGRFSGEQSDNWLSFIELPKRTRQELGSP